MSLYRNSAYLIVICDNKTNAIERVEIWSSPEWQQSRCLPDKNVYIAYAVESESFDKGIHDLLQAISWERSRYHHLYKLIDSYDCPQKDDHPSWK